MAASKFVEQCNAQYYERFTQEFPVSVKFIDPVKGKGVFVHQAFQEDDVILTERPMAAMQHLENQKESLCCFNCFRFLGSFETQLRHYLQGRAIFTTLPGVTETESHLSDIFPCPQKCDAVFCSQACFEDAFADYHNLTCTKSLPWNHPLVEFKTLCHETNEIFLLGAKVYAKIINEFERNGHDMEKAMAPYKVFHSQLWWEVVQVPDDVPATEVITFQRSLKHLISQAFDLLKESMWQPSYDALFDFIFFSRLIGAFEMNNVSVEIPSPLNEYIKRIKSLPLAEREAHLKALEPLLLIARRMKEEKENEAENEDEEDEEEEAQDDHTDEASDGEVTETAQGENNTDEEEVEDPDCTLFPIMEGTGLYMMVGAMNHSCKPNTYVDYKSDCTLHLRAVRALEPEEELCISYIDQDDTITARHKDLREYGFQCRCSKCERELEGMLASSSLLDPMSLRQ
eukprot:GILK01005916.1.p1 GENE.GILK01005916.1~~GILK01005916.1.p1  ORF type:complete len:457 (-),score=81.57 GILK01005916.1:92-1462(-)